jgi:hypothetical protein
MAKSALLVMDVTLQIRGRIPDEAGYLKRVRRAIDGRRRRSTSSASPAPC